MFNLYLSFLFSIFLLPPILFSPHPNSRRYLCVNLQKRTLRKNRHELSLRLARNLMRSHRHTRAFRYHPHPMILHCASRVSNTCSKQSARGSFMHRGKIKRLSVPLHRLPFPSSPQARALQLTINLLLNLYQECLHVIRLKETSRAALVFSSFSRLP